MLRRRRLPALTGALAALTLSLAACGGTDGGSSGAQAAGSSA
ncbi:zinc ABC transporter substrate-binding protein, partial [Micrococcus luteus]|nr:zinc ABC transporter substrate-binding protein [Micrococcus luteus]